MPPGLYFIFQFGLGVLGNLLGPARVTAAIASGPGATVAVAGSVGVTAAVASTPGATAARLS